MVDFDKKFLGVVIEVLYMKKCYIFGPYRPIIKILVLGLCQKQSAFYLWRRQTQSWHQTAFSWGLNKFCDQKNRQKLAVLALATPYVNFTLLFKQGLVSTPAVDLTFFGSLHRKKVKSTRCRDQNLYI